MSSGPTQDRRIAPTGQASDIAVASSALAIRSVRTAVVGPARSRNAPAIAANVSHPANTGDEKRVSANRTRARENIRPAKRDKVVARKSADNARTCKRAGLRSLLFHGDLRKKERRHNNLLASL